MNEQLVPRSADPLFQHDCERCTFLGSYQEQDLYHCLQSNLGPTVIARRSSEGSDYSSGFIFVQRDPALREAWMRAKEKGLKVTE